MELTVTLLEYQPDSLHNIPVEEKYLSIIKKIVKEDSLQLVDYWSIDFDYDLITYQPKLTFCKNSEGLPLSCEWLAKKFGNIAIRCVDIFGNSTFQVINLRG
jgi:site-specific DNA-methyltransferase (adenine-specific)/adenine-specific DNA-methyltransferase